MRAGVFCCVLIVAAWTPLAHAKTLSSDNRDVQQIADIVNHALIANPQIQSAHAAVDAAQARLTGAGLPLNNPQLELEAERTDISTYTLGISQTIDWHDKRHAQEQAARIALNAARLRVAALGLVKATELLTAIGGISTHRMITTLTRQMAQVALRQVEPDKTAEVRVIHHGFLR